MNRTQIYLPNAYREALRKEAEKQRVTVSEAIRRILREKLEDDSRPLRRTTETLNAAAKRINKLGKRAPKDLASRLDEYLYAK